MSAEKTDLLIELLQTLLGEEQGRRTWMRWYNYILEQTRYDKDYVDRCFQAVEKINSNDNFVYDQMITVKNIKASLLCPHHLMPVELVVHIGYIPQDTMLGLSKFARIAQEFCKPPRTQEEYTAKLAKLISEKLDTNWVMVVVDGKHSCMRHRGIESRDSITQTQAIVGEKTLPIKMEFLSAIGRKE